MTYDSEADAAMVVFDDAARSAITVPVDLDEVAGSRAEINLDFSPDGRLVSVEILSASSRLPSEVLDAATRS